MPSLVQDCSRLCYLTLDGKTDLTSLFAQRSHSSIHRLPSDDCNPVTNFSACRTRVWRVASHGLLHLTA